MQSFIYAQGSYKVDELKDFEIALNDLAVEFNKDSVFVNVYLFNQGGF